MPVYAIYIQKETDFFGARRTFGNTYHYLVPDGATFDDQGTAEAVAAAEKNVTMSSVDFVHWQSWGPTDSTEVASVMRDDGLLTGTGAGPDESYVYAEVCALAYWPLPRSAATNKKRWLWKYLRMPSPRVSIIQPDMYGGSTALDPAVLDELTQDYVIPVTTLPDAQLSTPRGDLPTTQGYIRDYLRTRDINTK